eukprot:981748-Pyramimonas_sp.AAC.1
MAARRCSASWRNRMPAHSSNFAWSMSSTLSPLIWICSFATRCERRRRAASCRSWRQTAREIDFATWKSTSPLFGCIS